MAQKCKITKDVVVVTNQASAVSSGTVNAFVLGISSLLNLGIYLQFFPATRRRPSAFTGNTFLAYGYVADSAGELHQLSGTAINNNGAAQNAPDGWEGSTTLDGIRVEFSYTGISDAGTWKAVIKIEPTDPAMPADLFEALANAVSVSCSAPATATP
jgi:hypothetical protein